MQHSEPSFQLKLFLHQVAHLIDLQSFCAQQFAKLLNLDQGIEEVNTGEKYNTKLQTIYKVKKIMTKF